MIVVIEAGCAECHGGDSEPLVVIHQFVDEDAAKVWAQTQGWLAYGRPVRWKPHPQGGEHSVAGQGSVWITPLATPSRMFKEISA